MAGVLEFERVSYSYPGGVPALGGVTVSVAAGELVGLLGPNGAGKSTLLRLADGLLRPGSGKVEVFGREAASWPRRDLARRAAVVQQEGGSPFPFTVGETVSMGRWTHTGGMGWLGDRDREAVRASLARTGTAHLADRPLEATSQGERQRVLIARALAQEAQLLLLDEPVAHLDPRHQLDILTLLRDLNREEGKTVVMAVHDLNLAAAFCLRLVILDGGRLAADGPPAEVLAPDLLARVFGVRGEVDRNPLSGTPRVTLWVRDRPGPSRARPDGREDGSGRSVVGERDVDRRTKMTCELGREDG